MKAYLDKIGSVGSVLAAAACPACFPQLAALGAIFGLGALGSYESQIFLVTKILVVLGVVGHVLAYRQHRVLWIASLGVAGGVAFFLGLYVVGSEVVVYLGLAAMVAASLVDLVRRWQQWRSVKVSAAQR